MTAAKKKAFELRMKKARAAAKRNPAKHAARPKARPKKQRAPGKRAKATRKKVAGSNQPPPRKKTPARKNKLTAEQELKRLYAEPFKTKTRAAEVLREIRRLEKGIPAAKRNPRNKKARGRGRGRLNPEEMAEAEEMFLQFHGRPANRIIDHNEQLEYRDQLAELGTLKVLIFDLDEDFQIPLDQFGGKCQVACTPDGNQIYFHGGNMKVDLAALGLPTDKDYVTLGECSYIEYRTVKGFHDFEVTDYQHDFGEESGVRPTLNYDAINQVLYLAGGEYHVLPAGITN